MGLWHFLVLKYLMKIDENSGTPSDAHREIEAPLDNNKSKKAKLKTLLLKTKTRH